MRKSTILFYDDERTFYCFECEKHIETGMGVWKHHEEEGHKDYKTIDGRLRLTLGEENAKK